MRKSLKQKNKMLTIIPFSSKEEIFDILGWEHPDLGDPKYIELIHKLWDVGFNLDDWDQGFACSEKLHEDMVTEEEGEKFYYVKWKPCVYWLGMQMENYCVGYHYCEFEGIHWYTVHHS